MSTSLKTNRGHESQRVLERITEEGSRGFESGGKDDRRGEIRAKDHQVGESEKRVSRMIPK